MIMRNRKLLTVLCVVLYCALLFCGCNNRGASQEGTDPAVADQSGAQSADERLINEIYRDGKALPYVYLSADQTKVSAGDTVEVHVMLANSENLAAFRVDVDVDESIFEVEKTADGKVSELTMMSDYSDGLFRTYGYTATTFDVEDGDAGAMFLKIKEGTPAGEYVLSGVIKQYLIGTDDSGDTVADLANVKDMTAELSITVK